MTKETRVGLLVGLLFIIAFAVVLSQLTKEAPSVPANTGAAGGQTAAAPANNPDVRSIAFMPVMDSARRVAPAVADGAHVAPAGAPEVGSEVVAQNNQPAGNVESVMPRLDTEKPADNATPPAAETPITKSNGVETVRITDLAERIGGDFADDAATPHADARQPVAAAAGKVHEVKAGETLYQIAKVEYGPGNSGKYKLILDANKITNAAGLKVGQKLIIPSLNNTPPTEGKAPTTMPANTRGGVAVVPATDTLPLAAKVPTKPVSKRVYVVRAGDTLFKIARNTGTTVDRIAKANGVKNAKSLKIGEKLEIPG